MTSDRLGTTRGSDRATTSVGTSSPRGSPDPRSSGHAARKGRASGSVFVARRVMCSRRRAVPARIGRCLRRGRLPSGSRSVRGRCYDHNWNVRIDDIRMREGHGLSRRTFHPDCWRESGTETLLVCCGTEIRVGRVSVGVTFPGAKVDLSAVHGSFGIWSFGLSARDRKGRHETGKARVASRHTSE